MYTKLYRNITSLTLSSVLDELKFDLAELLGDDLEISFKCEFILEELLTNSFTHVPQLNGIDIQINIQLEKPLIEYYEIGVSELDFAQLLLYGQETATNPSLDKTGGLGLHLINQISSEFTCKYDNNSYTRVFRILL